MKSWHYVAIFIAIVAVICGLILYNASTIDEIEDEMVTTGQAHSKKDADQSSVSQEKIDVLNDVDFESDVFDEDMTDDLSDLEDADGLVADEDVVF